MIATAVQQDYANIFLAGLLPREEKLGIKPFHEDKKQEASIGSEEEQITIRLNTPVYFGDHGQKKYKFSLEQFNENVLVLRTIDVSRGAGHIVLKKQFIRTKKKEIIATIKK